MQHQNNLFTMGCDLIVISLVCSVFVGSVHFQNLKIDLACQKIAKTQVPHPVQIQYDFQVAFNLKHPSCTIETPLSHPWRTLETLLRHAWDSLETPFRYPWSPKNTIQIYQKYTLNTLKTPLRHPLEILETLLRHPWDTLETPLRHPWDTFFTPVKDLERNLEAGCNNNFDNFFLTYLMT